MVIGPVMMADILNLAVTVVTGCNDIIGARGHNLVEFYFAVRTSCVREPGLQRAAAAAAAIVIVPVGHGVDEIFFADNGFYHESQIIDDFVRPALPAYIAGVLNGKFGPDIFIPVGINLQFTFPDPLGV